MLFKSNQYTDGDQDGDPRPVVRVYLTVEGDHDEADEVNNAEEDLGKYWFEECRVESWSCVLHPFKCLVFEIIFSLWALVRRVLLLPSEFGSDDAHDVNLREEPFE